MTDTVKSRDFWMACASPRAWQREAEHLRRAASVLWEDLSSRIDVGQIGWDSKDTCGTALMLMAFALENLFKGIAVGRQPALVQGASIASSLKKHDLVELASIAREVLSSDQEAACNTLTVYGKWYGRYPAPPSGRDQTVFHNLMVDPKLMPVAFALYDRLHPVCGQLDEFWEEPAI